MCCIYVCVLVIQLNAVLSRRRRLTGEFHLGTSKAELLRKEKKRKGARGRLLSRELSQRDSTQEVLEGGVSARWFTRTKCRSLMMSGFAWPGVTVCARKRRCVGAEDR